MALNVKPTKTVDKCFIYQENKENFNKSIADSLLHSSIIDVNSSKFEDVKYEVKRRQISKYVYETLDNPRVKLIICKKALPRMLKVLTAKDIKKLTGNANNYITYVDVTGIVEEENGVFTCERIDVLVALLFAASSNMLWYSGAYKINGGTSIKEAATICYARLFTNIINYLAKINSVPGQKNKCLYASGLFFLNNLYEENNFETNVAICKKEFDVSDREAELVNMYFKMDSLNSLDKFVESLRQILHLKDLDVANVIRIWVKLYTPGTIFGLEYFPSFSEMLTDSYSGCYLNNQATIEKVCGNNLAVYCNKVIDLGGHYAR